jgi:hypothetical protein
VAGVDMVVVDAVDTAVVVATATDARPSRGMKQSGV